MESPRTFGVTAEQAYQNARYVASIGLPPATVEQARGFYRVAAGAAERGALLAADTASAA